MKKKRLLFGALLIGALISTPVAAHAMDVHDFEWGPLPITVHVDNEYLPMDVDPIIVNGRTMVPLRAAGEAVGATIDWNQPTQTASADVNGNQVSFTINSNTYYINGAAYTTDTTPIIKNGRTLLPLRAFGDACGVDVKWNGTMRDVQIDTPAEDALVWPMLPAGCPEDIANMLAKFYIQNDISDPLVGNWRTETTVESFNNSGATSQTKYLFITKSSDGRYHAINLGVEQATFYTGTGFCVQKLTGLGAADTFIFSPDNDPSTPYVDESILYHSVPGNNTSDMLAYSSNKYSRVENDLIRTGEEQGILGWVSVNEHFTRF